MKREIIYSVFSDMPRIVTDRLILRQMKACDARDMFEYASNPNTTRYLTWKAHPSVEYTEEYLKYLQTRYAAGDFYDFAVTLKDSGKMIGTCGFTRFHAESNSAEIGYVINPAYHGQGIATEAARAVISFGFSELKLHRIEARHMVGNDASHRVMEKLGMSFEGYHKDAIYVKGEYKTVGYCAITKEKFFDIYSKEENNVDNA